MKSQIHQQLVFKLCFRSELVNIDSVPYLYYQLEILFSYLIQIWQLFIIRRQPVTISVTVFSNQTKMTNDLYLNTSAPQQLSIIYQAPYLVLIHLTDKGITDNLG